VIIEWIDKMIKKSIVLGIVTIMLFASVNIKSEGKNFNDFEKRDFPLMLLNNNSAPEIPSKPSGPTYGEIGNTYSFKTKSKDPDGDQVRYGWDFTGDKVIDKWTSFVSCNLTITSHWEFWFTGDNNISVKAEDEHGLQSNFSEISVIYINTPPRKPIEPTGPNNINRLIAAKFYSLSQDADGDQLWFQWKNGLTISGWTGPFNSSQDCNFTIYWQYSGDYELSVRCKDNYNSISEWSDPLEITVIDPFKVKISHLNFGFIKAKIKNQANECLKNLTWNISISRNRILRNIDVFSNGTIDEIQSLKYATFASDKRIFGRIGIVNIKIRVFTDEIVQEPFEKIIKTYGIIIGRIIFIF